MQILQQSYAGVGLLCRLNADRLICVGAVVTSLLAGGWVASALSGF